jgi:hypothetical protein
LRGEQCEICNASLAPKPAQREWVGLTAEEWLSFGRMSIEEIRIGLAVQAKLKEKNNGT